jgi:hypothetical protein
LFGTFTNHEKTSDNKKRPATKQHEAAAEAKLAFGGKPKNDCPANLAPNYRAVTDSRRSGRERQNFPPQEPLRSPKKVSPFLGRDLPDSILN